ncbi:MAG: CBS domain-containing protein [Actinomycetota bacterium]|nr:CBS domain-containing protein [Actinomycetota bacterium]
MTSRPLSALFERHDGGASPSGEVGAAGDRGGPATEDPAPRSASRRPSIPARDRNALAAALLFVALSLASIYIVAKVADVEDGAVLASLLIAPALLYLLLSGRVSELKGPAGLEVRLAEVAEQTIPVPGNDHSALAYEAVRAVERGRKESFLSRIGDITPEEPVVLTLTLGSGPIDGDAAADYARGLTQFPRFRFVAIIDSHGKLISYMQESAFRHVIEADVTDATELLNNIHQKNVGAVRAFPGMIVTTVTPGTSVADALRTMERLRLNALLVTEDGRIRGIVERERLANALLLSLVEHAGH